MRRFVDYIMEAIKSGYCKSNYSIMLKINLLNDFETK